MEATPIDSLGGIAMAATVFRVIACTTLALGFGAVLIGLKKKRAKRSLGGVVAGMLAVFLAVRVFSVVWVFSADFLLVLDRLAILVLVSSMIMGLCGTVLCIRKKAEPNQPPLPTSGLRPDVADL